MMSGSNWPRYLADSSGPIPNQRRHWRFIVFPVTAKNTIFLVAIAFTKKKKQSKKKPKTTNLVKWITAGKSCMKYCFHVFEICSVKKPYIDCDGIYLQVLHGGAWDKFLHPALTHPGKSDPSDILYLIRQNACESCCFSCTHTQKKIQVNGNLCNFGWWYS